MADAPVYVIVGAAGGIGSELCRRLAARPCRLVLAGRDAARLDALADELAALGREDAVSVPTEATAPDAVDSLFEAARERFGRVDGAVNLAGSVMLKAAHQTSDEDWARTLGVNLSTAFYVLRSAVKAVQANDRPAGGSVVLMSSVAAKVGLANHEAIAAAKAGVGGLVISAAATYAARGVRVNAVAPGLVRTPLTQRLTANEATLRASTAMHPLGRIGEPADVAVVVDWLLDAERSGWVTGQVVSVDGGMATARAR